MTGPHSDPGRLTARVAARHIAAAAALAVRAAPVAAVTTLVLALVVGALPVAGAWLTKAALDRIAQPASVDKNLLLVLATALAMMSAGMVILSQLARYLDAQLARAVALRAQERLYGAVNRFVGLERLESPGFHDRLQLALHSGRDGPSQLLYGGRSIVQLVITTSGLLVTLAVLNPWLLAVVVLAAGPTLRVELALGRRRAVTALRVGQAGRREMFYGNLLTQLDAAKEVRLFGLSGFFRSRMLAELRTINAEQRRLDRRELAAQGALAAFGAAIAGAGLVWAVGAAFQGRLTVGDVSMFLAAIAGVQVGVSGIVGRAGAVHHALLLFDHYQAIVQSGPDLPLPVQPCPTPTLRQGIELRDVWFRYSAEHPWVLRGLTLNIPSGQSTGLVGLNGAGKSTIVKLLCRFYDPTRGAVLWDGIDLRELDVVALRERIASVFQDFMEYELSAAENIAVGDLAAIDDAQRIAVAARRAGMHDAVMALPRQYRTLLSRIYLDNADRDDPSTGVVLSGGQWQRIALARAFLRGDRDLLILDEPSAGLDAAAEYEIQQRLRDDRLGRTRLLISHRLSTIREADQIVVLADGVTTEQGTHRQLMAAGGAYARLFTMQAAGYGEADLPVAVAP